MNDLKEKNVQKKSVEYQEKILSDLQEIKFNMHLLMRCSIKEQNQESLNFTNPIEEIPMLFSQGKLGFSVILASIRGWMAFKLRKK